MLQERDGLFVGPQACRPFGRGFECNPRLARKSIRLSALRGIRVRGEIMAGQCSGQLIGFERLEEPGCGQVACLTVPPRQG